MRRGWRSLAAAAAASALACLGAAGPAAAAPDNKVWLCKPGFGTTTVSPTGEVLGTESPKPDRKPKADCFYVYPTVSDDQTPNADLSIDPEERSIALYQAARYSLHCRVFAPMYRQITLQALFSGEPITPEMAALGYGDVVAAWKTYLRKYNKGRGVIFIGHSQGTYVLRQLLSQQVDPKRKVRKRLISAILLGGNVTVPEDGIVGGDFKHIPGCEQRSEPACVIAFSTFNGPVPPDARFGRPGNVLNPDLPATGDVLCTNPANLKTGTGQLTSVFPSAPFAPGTTIGLATEAVGVPRPAVTTPWIQSQGYVGTCSSADDANVLQLTSVGGAPTLNAVPDATWGLHLVDANIALGNLTGVIQRQIKTYERAQR